MTPEIAEILIKVACFVLATFYILWLDVDRRRLLAAIQRHHDNTAHEWPHREEDEVLWHSGGLQYVCMRASRSDDEDY